MTLLKNLRVVIMISLESLIRGFRVIKKRSGQRELDKPLKTQAFLRKLREHFPIARIYYPGCYDDGVLECTFKPEEIVYLDYNVKYHGKATVIADYCQAPFRDCVFDALFFQDNHAEIDGVREMLRTLKPGGIVIYSSYNCGIGLDVTDLLKLPGLRQMNLPLRHQHFTILQKDLAAARI